MQGVESSTLNMPKEATKPKIAKLIEISVDENQMVYVNWPTDKKELCLSAMCEALKLVSIYKSPIVEVHKPSVLDFVRGIKHG